MEKPLKNLFREYPDVLEVQDVQKALRIGRSTAYKLLKSGALPSMRVGSKYRVPKPYLLQFVTENSSVLFGGVV